MQHNRARVARLLVPPHPGSHGGRAVAEWVTVCEVGPRDGLQMSRSRMATAAKVRRIVAWSR